MSIPAVFSPVKWVTITQIGAVLTSLKRFTAWFKRRATMSIANLKRPLISVAIVLGCCVALAAPASATTGPSTTDPNPFGGLTSNSRETAAPGSSALKAEVDRGLREGQSAWLPGLPAPAHPSQPSLTGCIDGLDC